RPPERSARRRARQRLLGGPDCGGWRRAACPPVEPPRSFAGRLRDHVRHQALVWVPRLVEASRRFRRLAIEEQEPETDRDPEEIGEYHTPVDLPAACRYRLLWPRIKDVAVP